MADELYLCHNCGAGIHEITTLRADLARVMEERDRWQRHSAELMQLAATNDIEVALGWVTAMQLAHRKLVAERDALQARVVGLVEALRAMMNSHGMHGPCEQNSCSSCDHAYKAARAVLKQMDADGD